jgi:hypothetical protein
VFNTQTEARQFFIDKVLARAKTDGVTLSDDEQQMLRWSEIETDSVADPALAERLAGLISDADYEAKIAGLLKRQLEAEARADATAQEKWQQVWSVLKQGDHYILVMIAEAIGGELKPWWRFW